MQTNMTNAFKSDAAIHAQVKRLVDGKFTAGAPFIAAAKADIDGYFKEAGRLINEVLDQKRFYDSPVKIASLLIGTRERLAYLQDLEHVGPLAIGNFAQLAVSTKNKALGSALVERLAAMPTKEKPVRALELAKAVFAEEWEKVQEAFAIAENRFQQITILYRSFSQHRVNAVQKVQLGLNRQRETGMLKEEIADDKVRQNES